MKADLANRHDIELLINTFYDKVKDNNELGYIFEDIAKLDWDMHLPKMYNFWSGILFAETGFSGNPMQKHLALSHLTDMGEKQFSEWLCDYLTSSSTNYLQVKKQRKLRNVRNRLLI